MTRDIILWSVAASILTFLFTRFFRPRATSLDIHKVYASRGQMDFSEEEREENGKRAKTYLANEVRKDRVNVLQLLLDTMEQIIKQRLKKNKSFSGGAKAE